MRGGLLHSGWPGEASLPGGNIWAETEEITKSHLCEDVGEGLQAARTAGAKALRPNELGVSAEQQEGQGSWN